MHYLIGNIVSISVKVGWMMLGILLMGLQLWQSNYQLLFYFMLIFAFLIIVCVCFFTIGIGKFITLVQIGDSASGTWEFASPKSILNWSYTPPPLHTYTHIYAQALNIGMIESV